MKLSDLVNVFIQEQRTIGQLLEDERIQAMAVAATHFYVGFGHLNSAGVDTLPPVNQPSFSNSLADSLSGMVAVIDPLQQSVANRLVPQPTGLPFPAIGLETITAETDVTASDWALIRPLFLLYCEREQALMLESSRVMGVDVFGRSSGEVQQDITNYEADLPQKAFIQPVFTI
jgi:hypothetical protein